MKSNSKQFPFPVVPFCEKQLRDINPKDVLYNKHFRLCDVYKGGGGYDKFPDIAFKRLGIITSTQFVAQLKGCPLKCSYCYVTDQGINGAATSFRASDMIQLFRVSANTDAVNVFHLMGGAPALYIEHWHEIINRLNGNNIFHSDLMLIEKDYKYVDFKPLLRKNCLFAVSIKGNNRGEFLKKTGREWNEPLFWRNFDKIVAEGLNFYITFTDINPAEIFQKIVDRYGLDVMEDSFTIEKVNYEALN